MCIYKRGYLYYKHPYLYLVGKLYLFFYQLIIYKSLNFYTMQLAVKEMASLATAQRPEAGLLVGKSLDGKEFTFDAPYATKNNPDTPIGLVSSLGHVWFLKSLFGYVNEAKEPLWYQLLPKKDRPSIEEAAQLDTPIKLVGRKVKIIQSQPIKDNLGNDLYTFESYIGYPEALMKKQQEIIDFNAATEDTQAHKPVPSYLSGGTNGNMNAAEVFALRQTGVNPTNKNATKLYTYIMETV